MKCKFLVTAAAVLLLSAASVLSPAIAQTTDGETPSSSPAMKSWNYTWNTVTSAWDRVQSAPVSGTFSSTKGVLATYPVFSNGVNFFGSNGVANGGDGTTNSINGNSVASFGFGFNGTTWDRVRSGATGETSSSVANTGIQKQQLFVYNGSAGNLVPLASGGSNADANAFANGLASGSFGYNGTNWDRTRVFGSVANVGTGVARVQIEEGYSSTLNVSAATNIKATAGRAFKVSVVTAGAVGQLCDTNTACAAANVIMTVPAAVGVYDINWPFATGLRYEPGAAQVAAFTWQ